MNRDQVAGLLAKASAAYPNKAPKFKDNPQIFELWVERLAGIDPMDALWNLNHHIDTNKFFPDIADILNSQEDDWDHEIAERNRQIAHQEWVAAGNDPEAFIYGPTGHARLEQ